MLRKQGIFRSIIFIVLLCIAGLHIVFGQAVTLDSYLNISAQSSPLLKEYDNAISINRIDSLILHKTFGPQVNAVSNDFYAPVANGWGYDEIATNIDQFEALISVTKDLSGKSSLKNQSAAFGLENTSLTYQRKQVLNEISKTVADQYIAAYAALLEWKFNDSLLTLMHKEDEVFKKLTESNIYLQTDYLSFIITVQQQQFLVSKSKIMYSDAISSLNYLCGIHDTSFVSISDPQLEWNLAPDFSETIYQKQLQIDSLLILNSDRQIDLNYRPKVDVYADAGYLSTFQFEGYKNFGASIGLNVTIPLYDGGQRNLEHNKTNIQLIEIQERSDFLERQYRQQRDQLRQQYLANEQLRIQVQTQLDYMHALIEANTKLLSTGDLLVTNLLYMLNNYKTIQYEFIRIDIIKYQLINQLNYLSPQ